ncbi:glycoside hydrolase family 9 protein [Sphingomonas sp. Y38-1Y]|uniref:glycoside hydrolase family 9 protein n=1 Tax=Sphingomonas sp. Y38-1Y TaxID=3078265 RepID=UPI0028EC99F3|nr:glycoside hydrolase family 9 protein [Sphingomonas sp. Y38-1Y]
MNTTSGNPRLNQLGFRPGRPKRFVFSCGTDLVELPVFSIETLDGRRVFEGRLDAKLHDLRRTTGEHVRTGDFSALRTPGCFRVRVGAAISHPFFIGETVYATLARDAARAFFLIRANAAIDDAITGIQHAAGHSSEATLPVDGMPRDLTGGWYNAGDFGKWTHMAAISASQMMWLHELRPTAHRLSLAVPPIFPGLPDLLQQARWGLEWLLKMQNADGSVLHKIDSSERYAWGSAPEHDPFPRAVYPATSLDAGNFIGVMLQAERVFAAYDRAFAARCRRAALSSWRWLETHPGVTGKDVNYLDTDSSQEIAWATCAMAAATGEATLARRAVAALAAVRAPPLSWLAPQVLGAMSLARSGSAAVSAARDAILGSASAIANRVEADPYGFSTNPDDYHWGSTEAALNAAVLCLFAAEIDVHERPRRAAERLLDYVLGCNALDLSFVTSHGNRCVQRPYHWACRVWGIVMPGWASGGANRFADGADPLLKAVIEAGTPPARCFVDACEANGSWASNEGQTSENASLLLAAGLLGL